MLSNKIRVLLSRIGDTNFKAAFSNIRADAKASHRLTPVVACDTFLSMLKYGCAFSDYHLFHFYEKNSSERAAFLTLTENNRLIQALNNMDYRPIFEAKTRFAKTFAPYLHRDCLLLGESSEEDVCAFLQRHTTVFAKKDFAFGGKGVRRLSVSDFGSEQALSDHLHEQGYDLIEELIDQHPSLAAFCPTSVNTIRIATILDGDDVFIPYAVFRCGRSGDVDNVSAGGFSANLDPQSGMITSSARSRGEERCEVHPVTGVAFRGFQMPMWEEVLNLVREAAKICPQVRYVGWDVAYNQEGPLLVEGNYHPGHMAFQLCDLTGRRYLFEKYLKK